MSYRQRQMVVNQSIKTANDQIAKNLQTAAVQAEKIKELPELEMLSNKICEIEFMDVIRDIPGADTLISFFDGE